MQRLIVFLLFLFAIAPVAFTQEISEPKTGAKFAAKDQDASLLGVGLRTKTMLKVKAYAIGLYVADSAVAGSLQGKAASPELYRELVAGDFPKKVVMKFVRDVSTSQIRDAFRESLGNAGPKADEWINYFGEIRSSQEIVIAWVPGTGLQTKVAGDNKPAINDKAFASSVLGIWLGDKPVQDDLKKALVSRAPELLK
ncbi:MAG TPA: chalcone isomerase family protein [Candidatus Acidoferrum sp.]|nr:chalcone isomerase family protein [Candidatus Acidoferrum sp.]